MEYHTVEWMKWYDDFYCEHTHSSMNVGYTHKSWSCDIIRHAKLIWSIRHHIMKLCRGYSRGYFRCHVNRKRYLVDIFDFATRDVWQLTNHRIIIWVTILTTYLIQNYLTNSCLSCSWKWFCDTIKWRMFLEKWRSEDIILDMFSISDADRDLRIDKYSSNRNWQTCDTE